LVLRLAAGWSGYGGEDRFARHECGVILKTGSTAGQTADCRLPAYR
jgi:hypothetical protein